VRVSVWILALFAHAELTDGKEICGSVSVSVCLNLLIKGDKDTWPVLLIISISLTLDTFHTFLLFKLYDLCSRLELTVSQWGGYLETATQLQGWMESVKREVCAPLTPQPGPREKASQLERLRALLADLEDHQMALSSLEEKARELFKKTGDASFNHGARTQLQVQFDDLTALVEVKMLLLSL